MLERQGTIPSAFSISSEGGLRVHSLGISLMA